MQRWKRSCAMRCDHKRSLQGHTCEESLLWSLTILATQIDVRECPVSLMVSSTRSIVELHDDRAPWSAR